MAGINQLFGEDLQNIFKNYADLVEESPTGSGLPPGAADRLRMNPTNKPGGGKALNADEGATDRLRMSPTNKPGGRKALNVDEDDLAKGATPKRAPRNPQEKKDGKRCALLIEKARALASRAMYYEASTLLEEVDDNEEITDLGTKLLMAECYLQLGRENRANKYLKHLNKTLTSEPFLPAQDLVNLATDFIGESSFIRAMIILNIAVDGILDGSESPDEKLSGAYQCYSKLDEVVKGMLKQGDRNRVIAADMGMQSMLDTYDKIRGIRGCDRDRQVLREAKCCRRLDYNFSTLNDHKKSMQIAARAIRNLEDHFTPAGAQQFQVYGWLLHNLGVTLCNCQKYEEALAAHKKALEAKAHATDYENEILKKRDIESTKEGMKIVRSKMGTI